MSLTNEAVCYNELGQSICCVCVTFNVSVSEFNTLPQKVD